MGPSLKISIVGCMNSWVGTTCEWRKWKLRVIVVVNVVVARDYVVDICLVIVVVSTCSLLCLFAYCIVGVCRP